MMHKKQKNHARLLLSLVMALDSKFQAYKNDTPCLANQLFLAYYLFSKWLLRLMHILDSVFPYFTADSMF